MSKLITFVCLTVLLKLASGQNDGSQTTFLDDFVFSDESLSQYSYFHASDYDYRATNPVTGIDYSAHVLNITSGEWLTGISTLAQTLAFYISPL